MVLVGVKAPLQKHLRWGAAVWSADARGLGAGIAFVAARGFLGSDYSNNQAEYFLLFFSVCFASCVCRILMFFLKWTLCFLPNNSHGIFLGLVVLIALHQQCVDVCDSFSALHISWDTRHTYREFNQTADTLSNQAIDGRDSNGFSAFW